MSARKKAPFEVAISDVWQKVEIYRGVEPFLRTFGRIHPVRAALYATNFCQSEVRNGGLHQFFSNPTAVMAPEAVAGFRSMGLDEAAAIVEQAMRFFGQPYPRDAADRQTLLATVPGEVRKEWDPFYELDGPFYSALSGADRSDRFEEAANAYAAQLSEEPA